MESSKIITRAFLETVFEKYLNQDIQNLSFIKSGELVSGESYCSHLERIRVTYSSKNGEDNQMNVIAKYLPKNGYLGVFLEEMNFFGCELAVYNDVLRAFSKFDYREKLSPLAYYTEEKPVPILVLEDLSSINYKLLSRGEGLDMEHCLFVVEKLAYLHAASAALHEYDSTVLPKFNQLQYRENKLMSAFLDKCYTNVVETCEVMPELHHFANKLKLSKNKIYNKLHNILNVNTKFKVLNHGDCWTNNMLFCYNTDGRLVDLALIDFQLSCYGSPYIDLHYFLATTVKLEIKTKFDAIVNHYFEHLLKILGKLHVKTIPKREEFDEDFRRMAYYGFASSIINLPIIKATQTKYASLGNYLDNVGNFRHHCFSNENYRKEMLYYIPFYDNLGIFDF